MPGNSGSQNKVVYADTAGMQRSGIRITKTNMGSLSAEGSSQQGSLAAGKRKETVKEPVCSFVGKEHAGSLFIQLLFVIYSCAAIFLYLVNNAWNCG